MNNRIRAAWLSLLLAAPAPLLAGTLADGAEIHTFHCLHGCPMGAAGTNDLVVREIYTLSANDITKMSDWVAYRVTAQTVGSGEERRWQKDPWLSDDETLKPSDYDGAPRALLIDRGHQAPLAALSAPPHGSDTNIMSNITPQRSALNQSSWMLLEGAERKLAVDGGKSVYVLTGPLFEKPMPPMPAGPKMHRVPSGYWKVIATEEGGVTRVSSFLFDQETPRGIDFCTKRASLDEIELRARLHIFPRLAKRAFQPLDSAIGCAA